MDILTLGFLSGFYTYQYKSNKLGELKKSLRIIQRLFLEHLKSDL